MAIMITCDGIKNYKNGVEETNGIRISTNKVALGSAIENPVCIIFPDYVKEIEDGAFRDLTSLEAVYIPASVKRIGLNAFAGCTRLHRVIVHDSVEIITMREPQGKWNITSHQPFDKLKVLPDGQVDGQLALALKMGGYQVYLYKSGEEHSWD